MEKNILQVCGYAAPYSGNFIASLVSLAEENEKYGYKTIFGFPENARKREWCKNLEKNYIVYYLPLEKARIKYSTYRILKQIYKKHNIVIAHSHFELYDMPVNLMSPKSTKVFWHLHDALDLLYSKSNRLYKILWKIQYKYASKKAILLSVSEKGKNYAIKLGFKSQNSFFVPNAIDTKRIDCAQGKENKIYDFLIYGWDYYRKGVDVLEEAVPLLQNYNFKCGIVAGNDMAEKLKKEEKLIYQKPVDNVAELYKSIHCFLHISRQEGLSYALLEAIYAGVSVICSDIEQNMFAAEFPTVKMVPVGNSEMLAQKMEEVLTGTWCPNEEQKDISKKTIRDKYSIDSWVKSIQNFYFKGEIQ